MTTLRHIAFLTPEYPHTALRFSGGLGTSIRNLAKGLSAIENIKVSVFVIGQECDMQLDDDGILLVVIKKQKHLMFNWFLERKRYQNIIQNYIDKEQVQLIEVPDWTGISAYMSFTVPLIMRLHGSDGYFCHLEERKQKWKHRFLEQKALQDADVIVSVSEFTAKLTAKIFYLKKEIIVIHNSVDTGAFAPVDVQVEPKQLLYFGTLIRKKGLLELAKIFNKVIEKEPKCKLLIIGKDVLDVFKMTSTFLLFKSLLTSEALKQMTHLDAVPYENIKQYIASSQVVVLPSFAEAFPMTWLETLAMEKALVSSNMDWANELMIEGVTGYMVNPKDHVLYANRIVELLNDIPKCKVFGKSGRQRVVDHFSKEMIRSQNLKFYQSVL